jgi:hypothetical protein
MVGCVHRKLDGNFASDTVAAVAAARIGAELSDGSCAKIEAVGS